MRTETADRLRTAAGYLLLTGALAIATHLSASGSTERAKLPDRQTTEMADSLPGQVASSETGAASAAAEAESKAEAKPGAEAVGDVDPTSQGGQYGYATEKAPDSGEATAEADDTGKADKSGAANADADEEAGTARVADGRIDLNRADAALLDTLPGIGPAKAEAIIAWREANDGFENVDELNEVKGIGDRTLEKLRPLVCVVVAD